MSNRSNNQRFSLFEMQNLANNSNVDEPNVGIEFTFPSFYHRFISQNSLETWPKTRLVGFLRAHVSAWCFLSVLFLENYVQSVDLYFLSHRYFSRVLVDLTWLCLSFSLSKKKMNQDYRYINKFYEKFISIRCFTSSLN